MNAVGTDNEGKNRSLGALAGIRRDAVLSQNSVGGSETGIALVQCQLFNVNLIHADWNGGYLVDCELRASYFQLMRFSAIAFRKVSFKDLQLNHVCFDSCYFTDCRFEGLQLLHGAEDLKFVNCVFENTVVPKGSSQEGCTHSDGNAQMMGSSQADGQEAMKAKEAAAPKAAASESSHSKRGSQSPSGRFGELEF